MTPIAYPLCSCGKPATWDYEPGTSFQVACDDCVPRGCSCQYGEDGEPYRDEQGRLEPCVEWARIDESGWDEFK